MQTSSVLTGDLPARSLVKVYPAGNVITVQVTVDIRRAPQLFGVEVIGRDLEFGNLESRRTFDSSAHVVVVHAGLVVVWGDVRHRPVDVVLAPLHHESLGGVENAVFRRCVAATATASTATRQGEEGNDTNNEASEFFQFR